MREVREQTSSSDSMQGRVFLKVRSDWEDECPGKIFANTQIFFVKTLLRVIKTSEHWSQRQ